MGTTALRAFPGLGLPPLRVASNSFPTPSTEPSGIRRQPEPADPSSALEKFDHLKSRICLLWGQKELETYIKQLIMDSRDGKRQGFPWEVAQELMFLLELSVAKRALIASETTG